MAGEVVIFVQQEELRRSRDVSLVIFRAEGDRYAIAADSIQSIVTVESVTSVPGAPPAVAGVINVRGDVLTAVRMRTEDRLPVKAQDSCYQQDVIHMALVVEFDDHPPLAVLVDEVSQVLSVSDEFFAERTETVDGEDGALNLLRLDEEVVSLVEPGELLVKGEEVESG